MASKKNRNTVVEEFTRIHEGFSELFPHLAAVLAAEEEFNGLILKVQPDSTVLAVLKRFDGEGAPVVCFGVGYGAVGALHGVDRTVASGSWKKDTPYRPGK